MSDSKQATGGDAKPLAQNDLAALSAAAKKNAPSIAGASGGNATGPDFSGVDSSKRK